MEPITIFYLSSAVSNLVNSELSREATADLEDKRQEFQKSLENNRQEFQRQQLEEQKELQLELAEKQRKSQLELAKKQRETQLELLEKQRETQVELEELREVSQNWPLRTLRPASILKAHQNDSLIPLRLIPAPPIVDYDSFGAANKNFPNIEEGLAQGLREFIGKYYPHNNIERPVELLDGAWDSKRYHGGSVVGLLHSWLKSEPILILESVIDSNHLHFRLAYWGQGQKQYYYQSLIANLPYREIVYESVKARALQWKETQTKLAKLGKSPEEINRLGGDNATNLKILEQEEEYRQLGLDLQQLDLQKHYKVNEQDFKYLCQFLANCHCLVAGFIADIHYLIQNNVQPLLPKLLPELTEDFYNPQLLESIVTGYRQVYQALENERPAWMPDLALDLANSLKYLPDKSWAKEQVKSSIHSWLRVRGVIPPETIEDAISAMKPLMILEDEKYLTDLQQCLREIEESRIANQMKGFSNQIRRNEIVAMPNKLYVGYDLGYEETQLSMLSPDQEFPESLRMPTSKGDNEPIITAYAVNKDKIVLGNDLLAENANDLANYHANFKVKPTEVIKTLPQEAQETIRQMCKAHDTHGIITVLKRYENSQTMMAKCIKEFTNAIFTHKMITSELSFYGNECDAISVWIGCPTYWNLNDIQIYKAMLEDSILGEGVLVFDGHSIPLIFDVELESTAVSLYENKIYFSQDNMEWKSNKYKLVIDVGSSTVNVSAMPGSEADNAHNDCHPFLGARLIDKAIYNYYRKVLHKNGELSNLDRHIQQNSTVEKLLILASRKTKETYFSNTQALRVLSPIDSLPDIKIPRREMDSILATPLSELDGKVQWIDGKSWEHEFESFLTKEKEFLDKGKIIVDRIFLTGSAARMGFVQDICKRIFKNTTIHYDSNPSVAISHGLALVGRYNEKSVECRQEAMVLAIN
ncbi:MAG: hypothetical protein AB4372_22580 [Xenococcus sp. (in: cyanobacteria)]